MEPSRPSPDEITAADFQKALDEYAPLIRAMSASKGAREGGDTLQDLDDYRYGEAPRLFSRGQDGQNRKEAAGEVEGEKTKQMGLDDVQRLVRWKLRRGTFRPTLLKLVLSNDAATVRQTVREANAAYHAGSNGERGEGGEKKEKNEKEKEKEQEHKDVAAALAVLTRLKGIGPATASLLLAVHAPDEVVFFADEAFHWLCCRGRAAPIRYTAKEYRALNDAAGTLARRLKVRAVDVEKVAFVMMRRGGTGAGEGSTSSTVVENRLETLDSGGERKPAKRRVPGQQTGDAPVSPPPPTRTRPKRQKKA